MSHGYPDYTYFSYPLGVFAGGTGTTALTLHGVLIGQGTASLVATAAGTAYEVLTVPVGGGDPIFDVVHLDQAAAVAGILAIANGGTGSANGSITGSSDLIFTAGGASKHVCLLPSTDGGMGFGVADPSWAFEFMSGTSAVDAVIVLQNNATDEGLWGVSPAGVISPSHPIWAFGIRNNLPDGYILAFNGTVDVPIIRCELDGHVSLGGVRIAPAPTAGQILIASSTTDASWTTPDGCCVYNDAAESIPNNSFTSLTFNQEVYDRGGLHSTVTNTNRITAQKAGTYLIQISCAFAANATGIRSVSIKGSGGQYLAQNTKTAASTGETSFAFSGIVGIAAADWLEIVVQQTSGGALNVVSTAYYSPFLFAQWLGP